MNCAYRDGDSEGEDGRHELGIGSDSQQERQQDHRRDVAEHCPQHILRRISTSAVSQRRHLHVLDDQAGGTRGQETEKSNCAPARNRRHPRARGHGLGPPRIAACTGLLQALSERGSAVGATNAPGVANFHHLWDELEPEGSIRHGTHTTKLAKVYDPALCRLELVISVAEKSPSHPWGNRANRSESSSRSSSQT